MQPSLQGHRHLAPLFRLAPTREVCGAGGRGDHMSGLLLHPWLLTGSLALFGVHLEQETASTNTLNAVFPRGQGRMGNRKDPPLPSLLPASWALKKGALLQ